ncbi:hypothetical protein Syun_010532 [Stephania yunnanensis]|uniref:Uncharacterized protein n=1 Tax=Stephania yunnanensis TaxID=152371 RepID=A0AAP0KI82_9MAGN
MLGLMLHLPVLHSQSESPDQDRDSLTELTVPSFANSVLLREAKGILVNTFGELERYAIESLVAGETPKVYAVGPMIDVEGNRQFQFQSQSQSSKRSYYKKWLDEQPKGSVVLLCFGSRGGFTNPMQVREVAAGLEKSRHRFLWVLRRAHAAVGGDRVEEVEEGLPEGFEGRVEGRGMVCEWVDQVGVLGHRAIGGTWPMYAEQQLNAFYMVREKGLAVEMRLDCRLGGGGLVTAEEVERGVNEVMEKENEVRRRVEEMSKRSREAVGEGGSSLASLRQFVHDLLNNYKVLD